jgi:hypothetical protein
VGQEIHRHLWNISTSRQTVVQFSVPNSSLKKGEKVLLLLPSVNSHPDQANSYTKRKYSHFKIYIHATINPQVGAVISIL